jgi:hypothetical protein
MLNLLCPRAAAATPAQAADLHLLRNDIHDTAIGRSLLLVSILAEIISATGGARLNAAPVALRAQEGLVSPPVNRVFRPRAYAMRLWTMAARLTASHGK